MTIRRQRRRIAAPALVVTIAFLAGLAAGPSASASWTRPLTATGTVVGGTVATAAAVTVRDAGITNDDYQTTHVIQVTNSQPAGSSFTGTSDVTLTVAPTAATGLGARMSVAVWPVAAAATCADATEPAAGFQSAVWTAGLVTTAVQVTPGASAYFCVRGFPTASTPSPSAPAATQNRVNVAAALGIAPETSATGSQSFTPTYTATLRRGNFTGQATATGTTTISTSMIFSYFTFANGAAGNFARPQSPASTCWNIAGGGDTSPAGADLIAYAAGTCVASATAYRNERFLQVPLAGASAYQIRSDATIATNGFLEANAAGTIVETQAGNVSQLRQVWIGQTTPGPYRQFVNAATGLCLQAPAAAGGTFSTAACTADARFRSSWFVAVPPV